MGSWDIDVSKMSLHGSNQPPEFGEQIHGLSLSPWPISSHCRVTSVQGFTTLAFSR